MLALQRRPTPPQKIKSLFGTVLTTQHIDIVSLPVSTRPSPSHLYGARGTGPEDKLSSSIPEYTWKTRKRRLGRPKAPAPLPACQWHRMDLYRAQKLQRGALLVGSPVLLDGTCTERAGWGGLGQGRAAGHGATGPDPLGAPQRPRCEVPRKGMPAGR